MNRRLQALALTADGLTYRQVGARLYVSPETVKTYLQQVRRELGARTTTEAVAIAIRRGEIA